MDLAPDRTLDDLDDETTYDTAVVGAGLAGLAAAAVVARGRRRVAVLDTRSPGGRARTDERDGYRVNQGAHALYRAGAGMKVLDRLGVRVAGHAPELGKPAALYDGTLFTLPTGPASLLRSDLLSPSERARMSWLLGRIGFLRPAALRDRSAAAWIAGLELPPRCQALVEGLAGRPPVEVAHLPGVFLAGDWVGPVGLLADASLASGYAAGDAALHRLEGAAAVTGAR